MTRLAKCALCLMFSFFVIFAAVGYAETTMNLNINGSADATPPEMLYVSTTQKIDSTSGGEVNNLYQVLPTNVNSEVVLPNSDSSVTVLVRVFNNTTETYEFNEVKYSSDKYSNENITFSIMNLSTGEPLRHGDGVESGKHLSFEVTFRYKDGYTPSGEETLTSLINYEFVPKAGLPDVYIRDVELVSGSGSFLDSSIGTGLLNANFTSGNGAVYKLTIANRSNLDYGYYATIITNGSESTDISLVDYKLYKDSELTDALVRRDMLPKANGLNHGTLDVYLYANGKGGVANGTALHTIFDIRFQTPIDDIPPPGVEDGEIAVENALDKFREILNTDSEMDALIDLLNDVPKGSWGSSLRNESYVAYVPGAPDSDKQASLELFDGQLEIIIENEKQEVNFLIKREDVTGDGKEDFTVYMTTNPLTEETTVSGRKGNIFSGYYYTSHNKALAIVYAAVFTEDDNGEWVQLGDMFKGDAPICDYDGGMQNYRPSGASSNISVPTGKGSFHTDTWVSSEEYYNQPKESSLPSILSKEAYDVSLLKALIDIANPITESDDYTVIYTKESRDVLNLALTSAKTAYTNNTDTDTGNNNTQAEISVLEKALEKAIKGLEDSV